MKTALVTGGAGFIGSHVVDEFVQAGYKVAVVDNLLNGKEEFISKDASPGLSKVDIRHRQDLERVISDFKPEVVVHMAAIHFIPYCNEHPIEASEINLMGTHVVLDSLAKHHLPKRLFFASTAAVYPPKEGEHLETDEPYPMDIYGLTKLCGERMIELFGQKHDVVSVIGRLFNAVGPRETNPHLLPDIFKQVNAGERTIQLGNLTPRRDFVHALDMAKAIFTATVEANKSDIFNIGGGKQYSVKEVVDMISELLGEEITITQRDNLKRKVERPSLLAGIGKIGNAFGWQPKISLKETLAELLEK